jgi:hypothetical protein
LSLLQEKEWKKNIGKVVFAAPKRVEEDYLYERLSLLQQRESRGL